MDCGKRNKHLMFQDKSGTRGLKDVTTFVNRYCAFVSDNYEA